MMISLLQFFHAPSSQKIQTQE